MAGTQEFTTVQIKGKNYRVGYIRANVGALLIRRIMSAVGNDNEKAAKVLMGGLSFDDESLMQKELLSVVSYEKHVGEGVNYVPVFDGTRIFDPDLMTDPASMWILEQVSFNQNISPFFSESGQKNVMETLAQVALSEASNS